MNCTHLCIKLIWVQQRPTDWNHERLRVGLKKRVVLNRWSLVQRSCVEGRVWIPQQFGYVRGLNSKNTEEKDLFYTFPSRYFCPYWRTWSHSFNNRYRGWKNSSRNRHQKRKCGVHTCAVLLLHQVFWNHFWRPESVGKPDQFEFQKITQLKLSWHNQGNASLIAKSAARGWNSDPPTCFVILFLWCCQSTHFSPESERRLGLPTIIIVAMFLRVYGKNPDKHKGTQFSEMIACFCFLMVIWCNAHHGNSCPTCLHR